MLFLFNNISRLSIYLLVLLCMSCENKERARVTNLLRSWEHREVLFPENPIFTIYGKDTLDWNIQDKYKILTYVDTMGCLGCKLQLLEWKQLIKSVQRELPDSVQFLFFFSPMKKMRIQHELNIALFDYPICIDERDSLNKLNHFPSVVAFQTFLLDKGNKVIAIGNPIHNPQIRDLYLKIIRGEKNNNKKEEKIVRTKVKIDRTIVSLGRFDWKKEQRIVFPFTNEGNAPLIIQDVSTSCGCTSVSYSKEPVYPNKTTKLNVSYKAEHPGHFNKTITVYCNTKDSPIQLHITGIAE